MSQQYYFSVFDMVKLAYIIARHYDSIIMTVMRACWMWNGEGRETRIRPTGQPKRYHAKLGTNELKKNVDLLTCEPYIAALEP